MPCRADRCPLDVYSTNGNSGQADKHKPARLVMVECEMPSLGFNQIGGQLTAGLQITGFYEDRRAGHPLAQYMPTHFAICAIKP